MDMQNAARRKCEIMRASLPGAKVKWMKIFGLRFELQFIIISKINGSKIGISEDARKRGKLLTRIWRKATSKTGARPEWWLRPDATIGDPQCNGWFGNRDTIERRDGTDWLRATEGRCSIIRYLYRIARLILSLLSSPLPGTG